MSTEQNKMLVRRMLELIATGNTASVAEVVAPNWINIDPALPPMKGIEGAKQLITLLNSAFPDARLDIDQVITDGDRVAAHFSFSGTHKGRFLTIPPTGKSVSVSGTGIFRVQDNKIVENRVIFDALGMMQQIGVVPQTAPA